MFVKQIYLNSNIQAEFKKQYKNFKNNAAAYKSKDVTSFKSREPLIEVVNPEVFNKLISELARLALIIQEEQILLGVSLEKAADMACDRFVASKRCISKSAETQIELNIQDLLLEKRDKHTLRAIEMRYQSPTEIANRFCGLRNIGSRWDFEDHFLLSDLLSKHVLEKLKTSQDVLEKSPPIQKLRRGLWGFIKRFFRM